MNKITELVNHLDKTESFSDYYLNRNTCFIPSTRNYGYVSRFTIYDEAQHYLKSVRKIRNKIG